MSKDREKFIKDLGIKPDGQKAKVIRELPGTLWKELKLTVNPKKDKLVRISLTSLTVHHGAKLDPAFITETSGKFKGIF